MALGRGLKEGWLSKSEGGRAMEGAGGGGGGGGGEVGIVGEDREEGDGVVEVEGERRAQGGAGTGAREEDVTYVVERLERLLQPAGVSR